MTLPKFSGTALKRIACLCMLLDHIGASCLELGLMVHWPNPTGCTTFEQLAAVDPAFVPLYWADHILRLVGRVSFPLYCFLLAEGFCHTRSVKKYALRLAVFALVSEVPFDLAFFAVGWHPAYQNVYFTLLLGLGGLWWLDRCTESSTLAGWAKRFGGFVLFMAAAELLHTDYGAMGVVLIALFWLYREAPAARLITAAAVLFQPPTALLALPLVHLYSGERGRTTPAEAKAFYAFYPVHLALLAMVTFALRSRFGIF